MFRSVYGESFPIASVYDPQFWMSHIGSRFTSLLVIDGGEVIGHIAIQPDALDPSVIQVVFPLCHPAYAERIDEMGEQAWGLIQRQASRQSWDALSFVVFPHIKEMVHFAERVLGASTVAVCPAYFPSSKLRVRGSRISLGTRRSMADGRLDVLLTQRVFNPQRHEGRTVYVPEQHRAISEKLYSSLGLPREISSRPARGKSGARALPADAQAVDSEYFSKTKVLHAFVEPALISDIRDLERRIEAVPSESALVFLSCSDARVLEISDRLEERGFEFCGIVPFFRGVESILYSKSSGINMWYALDLAEPGRALLEHIRSQGSPASNVTALNQPRSKPEAKFRRVTVNGSH